MTTVEAPYDAEVEYIESTGTQWIDTGLDLQETTDVVSVTTAQPVDYAGVLKAWQSTRNGLASYLRYAGFFSSVQNGVRATLTYTGGTSWYSSYGIVPVGGSVQIISDFPNQTVQANSQAGTFVRRNTSNSVITLFTDSAIRISAFSIVRDGNLIIDLQPVRFTNELGQREGAMYDKVSGQLFRNAGTGSFVIGPDVRLYSTPVMGLHFMRDYGSMTAKDYIQDGLIAMWDGIENVGWGTHDAAAATWKDLIGSRDLTMGTGTSFTNDSLYAPAYKLGANYSSKIDAILCDGCFKIIANTSASGYNDIFVWSLGDSVGSGLAAMTGSSGFGINYIRNAATRISFNNTGLVNALASVAVDYSSKKAYVNGAEQTMSTIGGSALISSVFSVLGRGTRGEFLNCERYLYSLRLYSRALTAAEVAANAAVDKVRFNLP